MGATAKHIEANGLRIYYEVHGQGEPLLLIHGGTATSQSWASHLPAFTEHFQVFAPDSRAHGRTDNPTGELDYRLMADDVAALLGALGLQRPRSCSGCSTRRSWPSPLAPITASSKRKRVSSTHSPWISSCGIRAIDQPEEKTVTLPKTTSREEPSVLATNSRTGRFVCCLGERRDDA